MKTKEEILVQRISKDAPGVFYTYIPERIITFEQAKDCMQLHSDQQNKELREENERLHKKTESMERGIEASQRMVESEILERDAEIQRLTKEVEELKEKHEKQIADWKREEKMWGEHELHYKAEIQRLTKEVEELKLKLSGKTFFNPFEQENTRLRELLRKVQLEAIGYNESTLSSELLTEIDNALNHKP